MVASFVGHHSEELTFGTYGHAYDMMKAQIAGKTAEIIQAKEVAKTEAKDSEE